MMLELGAKKDNWAMAAGSGYLEIVRVMLEKGASDYGRVMRLAVKGGRLMLEKGADKYYMEILIRRIEFFIV
jgi:hypothetical protein